MRSYLFSSSGILNPGQLRLEWRGHGASVVGTSVCVHHFLGLLKTYLEAPGCVSGFFFFFASKSWS